MTDPLSFVIAGAAAGGAAGKFVETAWDSGRRWLAERYGSHAEQVRARASDNAAEFMLELASRVAAIEDSQRVTQERLDAAESHPSFSRLLERSLLNAAQTDDGEKHRLLAAVITERLTVDAETTLGLAASMASDAISRATRRQLRLLALMVVIDEVRPKHIESRDHFNRWLDNLLQPFRNDEFTQMDARHLVALACVSYERASSRDLRAALTMKAYPFLEDIDLALTGVPSVGDLEGVWVAVLAGVVLTSVGSITGGLVYNELTGASLELPEWG